SAGCVGSGGCWPTGSEDISIFGATREWRVVDADGNTGTISCDLASPPTAKNTPSSSPSTATVAASPGATVVYDVRWTVRSADIQACQQSDGDALAQTASYWCGSTPETSFVGGSSTSGVYADAVDYTCAVQASDSEPATVVSVTTPAGAQSGAYRITLAVQASGVLHLRMAPDCLPAGALNPGTWDELTIVSPTGS
ncbi:MAG: hypothetical protein ACHREM_08665, partial [Polyangiales bacterium]